MSSITHRRKTAVFGLLILAVLIAWAWASASHASTNGMMNAYVGANGTWFDNADPYQGDCEVTGNLSASLSPHITLTGGAYWGVCNSYLRGVTAARICATDVNNPDFSVEVGIGYRFASKEELRPNEWAPEVSVGYRPFPQDWPRLALIGQGWYGLDTRRAGAAVGVRWRFPL